MARLAGGDIVRKKIQFFCQFFPLKLHGNKSNNIPSSYDIKEGYFCTNSINIGIFCLREALVLVQTDDMLKPCCTSELILLIASVLKKFRRRSFETGLTATVTTSLLLNIFYKNKNSLKKKKRRWTLNNFFSIIHELNKKHLCKKK